MNPTIDSISPEHGRVPVSERTKLVPEMTFPAYTHVPSLTPHPTRDPRGHRYGQPEWQATELTFSNWRDNPLFLYGFDLLNHGYFWEAHDAWEACWHAVGRKGPWAELLKSLIKLAACGVALRKNEISLAKRHLRRAFFLMVQRSVRTSDLHLLGIHRWEVFLMFNVLNINDLAFYLAGSENVVFPFIILPEGVVVAD